MVRKLRTDEELQQATSHLYYEVWMFKKLALSMGLDIFGQSVINNALLESYTIHARVLLDFLYPGINPRDDDVIADDYFHDPDEWSRLRPEKSESLQDIHKRVGKEITHLTYSRHNETTDAKNWPFIQIANEMTLILTRFLASIPNHLISSVWKENNSYR